MSDYVPKSQRGKVPDALERWGFHDEAKALKKMAKDEHEHSVTLQSIIGTITAQITENPCPSKRR